MCIVFSGKEGITATAEEINEGEVKTKEVEMPIILGLTAKFTKTLQAENSFQIPNEESLKLMRDQKNNVNDSVENENMVSKILLSLSLRENCPDKLLNLNWLKNS